MSQNVIPRAFGTCLMEISNACSDFFTTRMSKVENKEVDESVHRAHASSTLLRCHARIDNCLRVGRDLRNDLIGKQKRGRKRIHGRQARTNRYGVTVRQPAKKRKVNKE